MSRESASVWMARRERRTCSRLPVTSEQRRQTDQGALALRVEPLFRLSGIVRRLRTTGGMRPPHAFERGKIGGNATRLCTSAGC